MAIPVIVNPSSAHGSTGREWPRIRERCRERLGPLAPQFTEAPGHAVRLAREIAAGGADRLVCVGGDGTFNEVVNGCLEACRDRPAGTTLAFIPRGTGCDIARSLGIPRDLQGALEVVARGRVRRIDLGRVNCLGATGRPIARYFHNVLSFGLGGEVDERVSRSGKPLGGFAAFLTATLAAILHYDRKRIRLTVDDHFQQEIAVWNIAVANGQYHGAGMWVAPGAEVDDGWFQITVIGDLSKPQVFRNLPNLYNGRIYEVPKVFRLKGKSVRAESAQRVLIDMDGEQPGCLPLRIDLLPAALPVTVP